LNDAPFEGTLAATRACRAALDGATAINAGLSNELTNLGKDADAVLAVRGALASSLAQARERLEELRRAQASSEARAALFRDLALKLKRREITLQPNIDDLVMVPETR
jgi:hypothetical protein